MKAAAIVVAGGGGLRAGGGLPKQYRLLLGKPVLAWSVSALRRAGVSSVIVVTAPEHRERARAALADFAVDLVDGGSTRTQSVAAGLAACGDADLVLIHDAARPGLTPEIVRALIAELESGAEGAAPALPIHDALWRGEAQAREAIDRDGAMRVQTPQAFRGDVIRRAYAAIGANTYADDIAAARAIGAEVRLILGDERLRKLTVAEDFAILESLMSGSRTPCVGTGFDAHRFGPGDFVTLCGVRIPHDKGLIGHSDADAGWHALVDAILGALGEGDIGEHFPPSDPQWKGAGSERFLSHARALCEKQGARIVHIDVTLICERPKIAPHREEMRARTAEVLGLDLGRVSVKATTTERLGFLGREEGLAAQATATVERAF